MQGTQSEGLVTKYEYARLISARVIALENNAPPTIDARPDDGAAGLMRLAEREFAAQTLPLILVRRSPSGQNKNCDVASLVAPSNKMNIASLRDDP